MKIRIGPHALLRFRERFPANMPTHEILNKLNSSVTVGYVIKGTKYCPSTMYFPVCEMLVQLSVNRDCENEMFAITMYQNISNRRNSVKISNVKWFIGPNNIKMESVKD